MGDAVSGFIKGFAVGWAMFPSKSEREYEEAKTRLMKAQAANAELGKDTTKRDANYDSQIASRKVRDANDTMRAKAYDYAQRNKKTGKDDEEELEVPASAYEDDLNEDVEEASPYEEVGTYAEGGSVQEAIPTNEAIPAPGMGMGRQAVASQGWGAAPAQPQALPMPPQRVQRFANGGGVVAEDEMTDEQPAVPLSSAAIPMAPGTQQLAPEVQQPPAPAMAEPTTQAQDAPGFSYTAALDAAKAGLEEAGGDVETEEKAIPAKGDKPKTRSVSATPATVEEVKAMDPMVDPEKKLSESQRNAKKLAWGYEHYLQKGDPKKAKEYAVSMVKAFEDIRNRFNTIAAAKAGQGDVDGAIGAALRAYAYVPDGLEVKLQKTKDGRFAYSYTDNVTGKVVSKGLKTPEEMMAIVTRGAASSMEELVARASDMRHTLKPDVAAGVMDGKTPTSPVTLEEANAIGGRKAQVDAAGARADAADAAAAKADEVAIAKGAKEYPREAPAPVKSRQDIIDLPMGAYYFDPNNPDAIFQKKKKAAAPAAGE